MSLVISDLHIHSRFSRATSKYITYPNLYKWALIKGVDILGTGDILHPQWIKEAKDQLVYDEKTGFYRLNSSLTKKIKNELAPVFRPKDMVFVPTVETSHIYKQGEKIRRIHLVIVLSHLEKAEELSRYLAERSNVSADGRPIFGINVRNMVEIVLEHDDDAMIIPAHIWTPHFSLFGSKSGFDSVEEAFADMSKYITTLETGLSSDPFMNRLVKELDRYILTSNSDSHSLERIGREANVHTKITTYEDLLNSLKTGENLVGTIEFYPQEGKYHYDGHRNCKVSFHPTETKKHNGICPKCNQPLTIGVLNRVYQLAKGQQEANQKLLQRYKTSYIIPLDDIIAAIYNSTRTSTKVKRRYLEAVSNLGPELEILLNKSEEEIASFDSQLAQAIRLLRKGEIKIVPGYDGEYGKVTIEREKLISQENQDSQLTLI